LQAVTRFFRSPFFDQLVEHGFAAPEPSGFVFALPIVFEKWKRGEPCNGLIIGRVSRTSAAGSFLSVLGLADARLQFMIDTGQNPSAVVMEAVNVRRTV
jgi:hypothetical protein